MEVDSIFYAMSQREIIYLGPFTLPHRRLDSFVRLRDFRFHILKALFRHFFSVFLF